MSFKVFDLTNAEYFVDNRMATGATGPSELPKAIRERHAFDIDAVYSTVGEAKNAIYQEINRVSAVNILHDTLISQGYSTVALKIEKSTIRIPEHFEIIEIPGK
jgi:hypothetical protein